MIADPRFEMDLRTRLHLALDGAVGPHPVWAESPAAARVAAGRGGIRWPGRLLAVAAVIALAGGVALAVALRPHEGIAGCPTLADYAAASAEPLAPVGAAPGVSFPPVAPDASSTTGLLQPGTWAVVADGKGPAVKLRLRDVRECGRLPDYRSGWIGGSLVLATVDVRFLRVDEEFVWLGPDRAFYVWLGGTDAGMPLLAPFNPDDHFGVPGVERRALGAALVAGTSVTTDVVFDLPPSDLQANAYAAPFSLRSEDQSVALGFGWTLRPGRTGELTLPRPTPGTSPSTGELAPGQYATIADPVGNHVLIVADVDQVAGYPGRTPSPGHVFVEAHLWMGLFGNPIGSGESTWHAFDGDGRELPIIANADPTQPDAGVLQRLTPTTIRDGEPWNGWFVVEAPPAGRIRLELTEDGRQVLSYVIRQP
jgi:hypothetical protein